MGDKEPRTDAAKPAKDEVAAALARLRKRGTIGIADPDFETICAAAEAQRELATVRADILDLLQLVPKFPEGGPCYRKVEEIRARHK